LFDTVQQLEVLGSREVRNIDGAIASHALEDALDVIRLHFIDKYISWSYFKQ
jgi:hypothetical protein